ncbi:MAG: ATP-binding cassette domain-containing protein [Clostridiales bacterium]|nr:ATP-binding cassette domain-containing protein [Eubacteriales bacterium]MDH7566224.1 ATP-binding cassette domain-containing protein [Clostridiales bacterium]
MTQNSDIALAVQGLRYEINGVPILKGIDLTVHKGEFVGLIGPNGAGKTTLLKCINGICRAQGRIEVKGEDIQSLSDKQVAREIALMHQNTEISYPFLSIDIVLMGRYPHLKRMQGEGKEDLRIARESMAYTDTTVFENKAITQISGGERQRVLFAKVLAQQADILLLDEPTASLDITHQEQIFKYSRELQRTGKTVIAAVHDLKIASRYCSRLVLMKEGAVISDGSPWEVFTPENIHRAYGVKALVFQNALTGLMDFYISDREQSGNKEKVHIIGGGGSASGVIRYLFEKGYRLSAGVFSHGDSDLMCAQVFGADYIAAEPFCDISDSAVEANIQKIREADITILCSMPFGSQNLRNLEAAEYAQKLVIIEDDPPETRDFTGGKALELYGALRERAVVITSARLHEFI